MARFKPELSLYFALILLNFLSPSAPVLGRKLAGSGPYGSSIDGHTIFRDDYGEEIKDVDCPTKAEEAPKFIYNNNTYYRNYFFIFCMARYPITIDFDGNKAFVPTAKMIVANANPGNMSKVCYIVELSSYFHRDYNSPVGNYTCKDVATGKKTASIYINSQASWGWRFQNSFNVQTGQTMYVNQNSVTSFVIPCPATKPTLQNAILKKELVGTGDEVPLTNFAGFKTSYNPFQGFTVNYSKSAVDAALLKAQQVKPLPSPPSPPPPKNGSVVVVSVSPAPQPPNPPPKTTPVIGKYVCSDPKALLTADVTVKHADFLIFPNQTNVTFDQGRITFECYSNKKVSLIVTSSYGGKLDAFQGTPRLEQFSPLGFTFGSKVTYSTQDPKAAGRIACVESDNPSKRLYEWSFDNGYICKCEWNNTYVEGRSRYYYYGYSQEEPEFGESAESTESSRYRHSSDWDYFDPPYFASDLTCYNAKAQSVDFTFHHCANPMECEFLRQSCSRDANNCPSFGTDYYYSSFGSGLAPTNRTTTRAVFTPGYIQCSADGYKSTLNVTTDWKGGMFFNDNKARKDEEILHIRSSESHVFTGDKMLYSCMAAGAGIAHPIVWAFELPDHSLNYSNYQFDSWQSGDRLAMGYSRSLASMRTTYLTIPSSPKSNNLYCFVPRWDSSGSWAKISVKLNVEDAEIAENPPKCPVKSSPIIVMYRNSSSISRSRVRLPHLVTGKDALVFDPVESVSLYCMAKFPIIWIKDGINITASRVARANCKRPDGSILIRQLYKSTVTFRISSLNATGNYTCRSISPHRSRQTSTYIYAMSPANRTTFVDEGKHHLIKHEWRNGSKNWDPRVVLPCRVNTPNIIPYLFLDIAEQEKIVKIPYKKGLGYLRFDPKVGFILDVTYDRIVRWNKTVFFCSDHEDGTFIGTMITLELVYDPPRQNISFTTTPRPNNQPSTSSSPNHQNILTRPTTPPPPPPAQIAQTSAGGSSTGFIVTTILLSILCVGCIGIIYTLYKKVRVQRAKPAQELDWTRAMSHSDSTGNGNGTIGNGLGHHHTSSSTHMNPEYIDTPNILQSLDNNGLIAHEETPTIEEIPNVDSLIDASSTIRAGGVSAENTNQEQQDRSLSSLSDADFGYKKL